MAALRKIEFRGNSNAKPSKQKSNGDNDYDDKDAGSNGKLVDGLTEISASITALCLQVGGFSKNLMTPAFYENHSFLNLIQQMLIDQKYAVDEAIRTLYGWALVDIKDIAEKSKIESPDDDMRDPAGIVKHLIPQFKILVSLSQTNWGMAIKAKNPSIVGLNIALSGKLTHFLWELEAIARKARA